VWYRIFLAVVAWCVSSVSTLNWNPYCGSQKDFVVVGTSGEELYGVCEAFYRKDLEPEDLFETISQCLLAAVDRDCLAGWGADVHIM